MLANRRQERGDTIIEVLFAFTIFSLIAVAGLSLMNQGVATAQRSLEIGLVRQQIDSQADALRYLNRAYVAEYGYSGEASERWKQVVFDNRVETAQDYSAMTEENRCIVPSNAFAIDTKNIEERPILIPTDETATFARINYDYPTGARAEGIWIQAVRSEVPNDTVNRPGFYDFHIRACWHAPGQVFPVTLGTIVRLYEPRG